LRRHEKSSQALAVANRIVQLRAALAEFHAGTTQEEWDSVANTMNAEYVEPDDTDVSGWLDDLPEDER
jgi:hypothetical protein